MGLNNLGTNSLAVIPSTRDERVVVRREMGSLGLARDAVIEWKFRRQSDVYAGISIN